MPHRVPLGLVAILAFGAAVPAAADSLIGRTAAFNVLAYDDPRHPRYQGLVHTATITEQVEFGLIPEGVQNGLDVVPVTVDISAHRIEISFTPSPPGLIADATFNGYVLSFTPDCLIFNTARVDTRTTTLPVSDADITLNGRTLYVNLEGLAYESTSRVDIELDVTDCPVT
ncbi:hypothetical protein [Acuticoccus sp. I52.16.1]|uniref:hypothetical protein n=1 Tax=Acuticoccus sp. I52.16.1 TaxID=2928472 RepID=UPI001FD1999F|nr:hypothetical protein [Acuticoccus sp. I52.16.1]UOM33762.1 hypothetical protein MRB58_18265 [Acuticoccus sp. I52.16.1]